MYDCMQPCRAHEPFHDNLEEILKKSFLEKKDSPRFTLRSKTLLDPSFGPEHCPFNTQCTLGSRMIGCIYNK